MKSGIDTYPTIKIYPHPGAGTPTNDAVARATAAIENSSTLLPLLVYDEGETALLVDDPAALEAYKDLGIEQVPVAFFEGTRMQALRLICQAATRQTHADVDAVILDARKTAAPSRGGTASDGVVAEMLGFSNPRIQVARDRQS